MSDTVMEARQPLTLSILSDGNLLVFGDSMKLCSIFKEPRSVPKLTKYQNRLWVQKTCSCTDVSEDEHKRAELLSATFAPFTDAATGIEEHPLCKVAAVVKHMLEYGIGGTAFKIVSKPFIENGGYFDDEVVITAKAQYLLREEV